MELKVAQLCPTLCDTMDYTVHGILQTRILKPFPSPGDHPNPGIEPRSPALQADSLPAEPQGRLLYLLIFPQKKQKQKTFPRIPLVELWAGIEQRAWYSRSLTSKTCSLLTLTS